MINILLYDMLNKDNILTKENSIQLYKNILKMIINGAVDTKLLSYIVEKLHTIKEKFDL